MRWLIPLSTAAWAFWTWSHQRELERKRERERIAALYHIPFRSASEDLQSRIYNILELDGLRNLRKRYPDGTYAEETLYLIVRYFGWLATVLRYGPYPYDQVTVRLTETVRNAFATAEYPIDPFSFFRPEQKALGKIVMVRFESQHGIELDTIPFYDFKNRLALPPLSDSESVKQSLDALRKAEDAGSLAGKERLAEAQCHLVDSLTYEEAKLGFSFFSGERKKCLSFDKHFAQVEVESGPIPQAT